MSYKIKKVLYLMNASTMGGATLSLLTLMNKIRQYNYTPIAIIPRNNEQLERLLKQLSIKYYVVPVIQFSFPKAYSIKQKLLYPLYCLKIITTYIKNIKELRNIAISEQISIIHTNVGPVREGHVVAKQLKIPHVWHIREYGDKDFGIRYFPSKKFFYKSIKHDYVITITKDLKYYNRLDSYQNAFVIYNGVRKLSDITYYSPKKKFFLCASRISPEKGHLDVIRAFAEFRKNRTDYNLVILGDINNKYYLKLQSMIADYSLEDCVVFKGFTTNVSNYMKEAKALIVASYAEGFGRMTAEAMFYGCLVLGRNTGGTKEILDQTGGFQFNNITELTQSMLTIANLAEDSYRKYINKAQSVCGKLFSEEGYISKVNDVYNIVLSHN